MNGLKQIRIKVLAYLTCYLVVYLSASQSCIQNLDSAIYFKYINQQKAKFYANALLVDLDSARCPGEIGIAATYNNLGLLLWEINEKPRGLYALKKGISRELQTKDFTHEDLIGPYYNLATLYQETSSFKETEKYLNLAEQVINENYPQNKEARIRLLSKKGSYYREIGDFNKSLDFLNQAMNINGAGNTDSTSIALHIEIGTTYKHFGDLEQSENKLLKAIELAKNTNELQYLIAIDRLSTLKIEQGEYSDSENYLLYNLKRKEEKYSDDPILALETLNGLSILYRLLNDLEASGNYMNQALSIAKNVRGVRPFLINNLGTIYMKKGDLDKAFECFKESTQRFKELYGKINSDYASGLSNLATVYKQQGMLSKALNLYTHVLDLDEVIFGKEHQRYATSLNNIALIYLELGNISLAGKLLQQSIEIRKKALGEYHPLYIKNLNDLGIYSLSEEDTVKAMDHFNKALHLEIQHMQDIFPVLTDKQRQLYFNNVRLNVERFNSLAFSDGYINTTYAEQAFNHFINTKGILFYASEKMRRIIQNSDDKQVKNLYDLWKDKKYQLAQAYLLTTEERNFRKISMEELEEKCNNLEKSLAQKISVFSEVNRTYYYTWQEVSSILDENTATVDIISYRNYNVNLTDTTFNQGFDNHYNYIALVIKPDSILYPVKLSPSLNLEKEFIRYRNALKYAINDNKSYSLFWKPIDKVISNCTNIKFAPDGIYHKMNPSVYFDSTRNKYMADLYNIINITSAKDLLYHQEKDLNTEAKIFGNPDFSSLELEFTLNQLPGAEREASAITEILDARSWQTSTYYFKDATEESLKSLANPGILHLATHGYFDDDPNHINPLNGSGIFLSKEVSGNEDGKLTAYEAMNLELDETNAVVLTACETGLGTVQNGEGVFGLQRALLVAGSQNVILSLVKINDQAAMNFMRLFYQFLLEVKDPQDAFFEARRTFKEKDTNPYNWGAYILVSKG
ncbi:MAG: CHAT domain-containing tetratricopeptide repeat protein [Pseudomonadota bacterium]